MALYKCLLIFVLAVEVFEAIAQPTRREILRLLAAGEELSAGEIVSHFNVTQPAISQHLKVLRDVGLISERRDGTKRLHSIRAEGIAELNDFLAEILPSAMARLKAAAELEERTSPNARAATRN